ncbi:MAG: flagellar FlbD family protein [Ruminococcaceae bacterium]|nr:flagellar FlbD family protein [Oscillospiraceae bacterium]
MITLTKLNKEEFVLNCDLIETIQENPDTTIRLTNGNIYIVRETMQDVVDLTVRYKRSWFTGLRWQEGNKA